MFGELGEWLKQQTEDLLVFGKDIGKTVFEGWQYKEKAKIDAKYGQNFGSGTPTNDGTTSGGQQWSNPQPTNTTQSSFDAKTIAVVGGAALLAVVMLKK